MIDDDSLLDSARQRLAKLQARLQAGQATPVRLIETHLSWILLGEEDAYKLKKPLRLPFVDFRSLQSRQQSCLQELRLNQRLAPTIYREVVEVREGDDGPDFGGSAPVVDYAVRMRRFADGSLWSERLAVGGLEIGQVEAMSRRLADFHRDAPVMPAASRFGSASVQQAVTQRLIAAHDAHLQAAGASEADFDWPRLRDWLRGQLTMLAPFWDERRRQGRIREGHGDLHLANLLQEKGCASTAFDAIDFDAELRCIDVIEDIAFLVMDLLAHSADTLAWRFLDVYLEASGDYAGLPALRFYLVRRALVRAQVRDLSDDLAAVAPGECDAAVYRTLAARLAFGASPWLVITHGLPASGKSHVALRLVTRTGAVRLRSDVERKRLFQLNALDSSKAVGDIYTEAVGLQTYQRLFELAGVVLRSGWPVVVDAAFLRRAERAQFAALASSVGVRFGMIDCRATQAVLEERIQRRAASASDPSEADLSVLAWLRAVEEPLDSDELAAAISVDAGDPRGADHAVCRWLEKLGG
ncbi:MAG: AAA family ATPase [Ideonella sp.]